MKNSPMQVVSQTEQFLGRILHMLGIEPKEHDRMMRDVAEIIALEAMNQLFEKLNDADKTLLKESLAGKSERQQQEILEGYFGQRYSPESRKEVLRVVGQRVVSDYIVTLLGSASPAQREEVKKLAQAQLPEA